MNNIQYCSYVLVKVLKILLPIIAYTVVLPQNSFNYKPYYNDTTMLLVLHFYNSF